MLDKLNQWLDCRLADKSLTLDVAENTSRVASYLHLKLGGLNFYSVEPDSSGMVRLVFQSGYYSCIMTFNYLNEFDFEYHDRSSQDLHLHLFSLTLESIDKPMLNLISKCSYRAEPATKSEPSPFDSIKPSEDQQRRMFDLKCEFESLYGKIKAHCNSNRECSLALTKLEECAMWVNKSITRGKN